MTRAAGPGPRPRVHSAWIVIVVTFLALCTREPVSRINPMSLLVFAALRPVIGGLGDRFGPRVILPGSMLVAGLGTLGMANAPSLFSVGVLYAIVGGVASGGAAQTTATSVATGA